ncbi:MAG: hypothetical protein AABX70_05170 [Nanoarchaeota archaeon]
MTKTLYIPVMGGLCSGKSSAVNYVREHFPSSTAFNEYAGEVLARHALENGLSGSKSNQVVQEIVQGTYERLEQIAAGSLGETVVEESGLIGALAHLITDEKYGLFARYFPLMEGLLARVSAVPIFVDVPPPVAWERRKERYLAQTRRLIVQEGGDEEIIMEALRTRMQGVYENVHALFEAFPCRKIRIQNIADKEEFLQEVDQTFKYLLGEQ